MQAGYARERRIADTLQAIILHTPLAETSPVLAIEAFYEAASDEAAVGGDFSDVFTYDGGKVALVVGDISGKGLQAATLIAEIKYALRTILREYPWPEKAMGRLNDFVCEAQRQGDFAADYQAVLSLVVFDPETSRVSYVTAGGEPLLIVRANGAAEVVGTNGLLLGVMPNIGYQATEAVCDCDDTLLLATDGLTEARRPGAMLGFEGLQAHAAASLPGHPLRDAGQALIESVRGWAGGTFSDDVCVLLGPVGLRTPPAHSSLPPLRREGKSFRKERSRLASVTDSCPPFLGEGAKNEREGCLTDGGLIFSPFML